MNDLTKLRRIENVVRELIYQDSMPIDEQYMAGVVLVSSVLVGPNIKKIVKFTGYPTKFIEQIGRRLRKNGVWVGNKVNSHEWTNKDSGYIAFTLDVEVALGNLTREFKAD